MSPEVRRSIIAAVGCPKCGATKGEPCRRRHVHQARVYADLFRLSGRKP